jgi:hypothetical protein
MVARLVEKRFAVGEKICARWKNGTFFEGEISTVNDNNTYAVQYNDGDFDKAVIAENIKRTEAVRVRKPPQLLKSSQLYFSHFDSQAAAPALQLQQEPPTLLSSLVTAAAAARIPDLIAGGPAAVSAHAIITGSAKQGNGGDKAQAAPAGAVRPYTSLSIDELKSLQSMHHESIQRVNEVCNVRLVSFSLRDSYIVCILVLTCPPEQELARRKHK